MLTENSIRCFLSVAETLSFTRSAEALYMTRQAVSQQILRLEADLHARLFDRRSGGVRLTEAGRAYYATFAGFFQRLAELKSNYAEWDARINLRLGYLAGVDLRTPLNDILFAMQSIAPEVHLSWVRHEPDLLLPMVQNGELDAAISYDVPWDLGFPRLKSMHLADRRTLLCVSRRNPKVTPMAVPSDFSGETLIGFSHQNGRTDERAQLMESARNDGVHVQNVRLVANWETAHSAVEMGEGISICSDISEICRNPEIKTYLLDRISPLFVFWREDRLHTALRQFLDCLQQNKSIFAP